MICGLVNEHLALAEAGALRAIDAQLRLHTAEEMFGGNEHVETKAWGSGAAMFAAFKAHPGAIENLAFIVDHGARGLVIAHDVDVVVHVIGVVRPHHQTHIVQSVGRGEAVIDLVERARVRTGGGEGGFCAQPVGTFDVELDNGAGGLAGDWGGEAWERGSVGRHGDAGPGAAID